MDRRAADIVGSLVASAIIALMVAAGGAALTPTEPLTVYASSESRPTDPLTMCRVQGAATVCVREES
jgi:hypothetical protein